MTFNTTARRRWLGALALAAAVAMLIAGQTLLAGRLSPLAFLIYWLICFAFTGLAILIAFLDVKALQSRILQERRDLFQATLKEIETDAKSRPRPSGPPDRSI